MLCHPVFTCPNYYKKCVFIECVSMSTSDQQKAVEKSIFCRNTNSETKNCYDRQFFLKDLGLLQNFNCLTFETPLQLIIDVSFFLDKNCNTINQYHEKYWFTHTQLL